MNSTEVGRELKVSDLKTGSVVWLFKQGRAAMASLRVVKVSDGYVYFRAGALNPPMAFLALRTGEDNNEVTDDSGEPMKVYEYLGAE